ncbi:GGDEF domain-containing protein [Marinospirillum insulare]|uniref:diguanylate cyclase n=1 Tax=Marinospirillum insulare TaxID=217169 RepID=A0ABQ5ZVX8_9GAMM|nr:GGDEF domain-containing protein [Marinospirillum insulare]GLR62821.1 GGDEF domain-containing protein [Marinospirillum insulare]
MYYRLIYTLQLFIAPLSLAAGCFAVIKLQLLPESLHSFSELLVWVFAVTGGLLALSYARTRVLFALLLVLLSYWLLEQQVQQPSLHSTSAPINLGAPLSYLLISLLLPLLLTLNSLWSERFHLMHDLLLRTLVFSFCCIIFYAISQSFPLQLSDALSTTYFPSIYVNHLGLAQLPLLTFFVCIFILLIQLIRNPQPYLAAQLTALISMVLMLQWFHQPLTPTLVTLAALLMLSLAVLQEAFQMAFRDDLTGLPGRRALNERLQRLGRNYSLAMADVDHFKKFNDTYGHDLGDQVLKMVATQLNKVSGGGKAYRYGGEEFTLVFPSKNSEQAQPYLEKLRIAIENYQVKIREEAKTAKSKTDSVSVTISMGVAERSSSLATPEDVIKAADEALYKAKGAGRNQTAIYK